MQQQQDCQTGHGSVEERSVPPLNSLPKKGTTASGTSTGSSSSELDPGELLQGWRLNLGKLGGRHRLTLDARAQPSEEAFAESPRGFWRERAR